MTTKPKSNPVIDAFIEEINKTFGEGSVQRFTDLPASCDVISTGSLAVNSALGIGGIPRGRFTEIFGKEASGKTTVGYHIGASAQEQDGNVYFVDTEHTVDKKYAATIGFDVNRTVISQPDNAEDALNMVARAIASGGFAVVILDSVAGLSPKAERDDDIGEWKVGIVPRLMGQMLRKCAPDAYKTNTAVVFINQVREKVGVMYGNPEVSPGGRALKFHASIRMEMRRVEDLKGEGGQRLGIRSNIKVVKNKLAPPFEEAQIDILFGKGMDCISDALMTGIREGVITRKGAWVVWQDQRWQGEKQAKAAIEAKKGLLEQLVRELQSASSVRRGST